MKRIKKNILKTSTKIFDEKLNINKGIFKKINNNNFLKNFLFGIYLKIFLIFFVFLVSKNIFSAENSNQTGEIKKFSGTEIILEKSEKENSQNIEISSLSNTGSNSLSKNSNTGESLEKNLDQEEFFLENTGSALTDSGSLEESSGTGENLIEELSSKKEEINNIIKKENKEEAIEKVKSDIDKINIKQNYFESINNTVNKQIDIIKSKITENENLKEKIAKENSSKIEREKKIKTLETEINNLKYDLKTKQNLIEINKESIKELQASKIMKDYLLEENTKLKQENEEKKNEEFNKKMNIFYLISLLFLIFYFVRLSIKKYFKEKKYKNNFVYFDVINGVLYGLFLIWFYFYTHPDMMIIIFFIATGIILITQDFIISFFSSLIIINEYSIGDKVRFSGEEGEITGFTNFRVIIETINKNGEFIGEKRRIPNKIFVQQEVIKIKDDFRRFFIDLVFEKEEINLLDKIKTVKSILDKNISGKIENEIFDMEYKYNIDYNFTKEGRLIISVSWNSSFEESLKIKEKIIYFIEKDRSDKKDSYKKYENLLEE